MTAQTNYTIHLDEKRGFKSLIDLNRLAASVRDPWFNQTLCRINDCVVRVGIARKGEFHWHKHEREDEFFYVVEGTLLLDFKDKTFTLEAGQGCAVEKGVLHRTRVPRDAIFLMIEGATINPTGDETKAGATPNRG
jgi:mannose-6-phosphate isomerase-like protein (cupin superfamily)